MGQRAAAIEIPSKQIFKTSEVCELLAIPSYVLRTWENEFKDLGISGPAGMPRAYRRADVELAARIRELVFNEHLTLAGVRRKLEQEHLLRAAEEDQALSLGAPAPTRVEIVPPRREKLQEVKRELRELLQQLANNARQELQHTAASSTVMSEVVAIPTGDVLVGLDLAADPVTSDRATTLETAVALETGGPPPVAQAPVAAAPTPKGAKRRPAPTATAPVAKARTAKTASGRASRR